MFLGVNPLRKCLRRVVRLYRNHCLYDQRPAIEFLGHKMHAAAMLAVASIERALVRVHAFVLGEQGGVDIQQAPFIVPHELSAEDAHETGQYHEFGVEGVDQFDQGGIEGFAAFEGLVIQ